MALVREILRSDLKDLTIVAYGGADVGMLCAAGKVKKVVFAFVSLDFIPLEPYFRQARQSGSIEVMEIDEVFVATRERPRVNPRRKFMNDMASLFFYRADYQFGVTNG